LRVLPLLRTLGTYVAASRFEPDLLNFWDLVDLEFGLVLMRGSLDTQHGITQSVIYYTRTYIGMD